MRTVRDLDAAGKRVLVRADFNVPLDGGAVADDTRIRAAMPTVELLLERGAQVILCSHLGRPKGGPDPALSLRPVRRLSDRRCSLGLATGRRLRRRGDGDVLLLENLRFDPREDANDPGFARALADADDEYVNDAFGAAHRAHASTEGVAHLLPAAAGLLLAAELDALDRILDEPEHPFVVVIGGVKVADKIGVIEPLLRARRRDPDRRRDGLHVLGCRGLRVGARCTRTRTARRSPAARWRTPAERGCELVLPVDVIVAGRLRRRCRVPQVDADCDPGRLDGARRRAAHRAAVRPAASAPPRPSSGTARWASSSWSRSPAARSASPTRSPTPAAVSVVGGGDSVAAVNARGRRRADHARLDRRRCGARAGRGPRAAGRRRRWRRPPHEPAPVRRRQLEDAQDGDGGRRRSFASWPAGYPPSVDVAVCAPFTALAASVDAAADTPLRVFAQNMHRAPAGRVHGRDLGADAARPRRQRRAARPLRAAAALRRDRRGAGREAVRGARCGPRRDPRRRRVRGRAGGGPDGVCAGAPGDHRARTGWRPGRDRRLRADLGDRHGPHGDAGDGRGGPRLHPRPASGCRRARPRGSSTAEA